MDSLTFPLIVNMCELLTETFEAGGVKPPFGFVLLRLEVKL